MNSMARHITALDTAAGKAAAGGSKMRERTATPPRGSAATQRGMRAGDLAYNELRRQILELELAPGQAIAEVETAAKLGISRTPLRTALARLRSDGLIVQVGARGLAVAPISVQDVRELTELREALDTQAARLAAQRCDPARFAELAKRFAALTAEGTYDSTANRERSANGPYGSETYALAATLDAAIDEAAANDALTAALAGVRLRLARVRRLAQDRPDRLHEAANEHRAIAEAISWGDPELAASAVRLHLRRSLQHATERLAALATEASATTKPPHTAAQPGVGSPGATASRKESL